MKEYSKLTDYICSEMKKDECTDARTIEDGSGSRPDIASAAKAEKPDIIFASLYPSAYLNSLGYVPLLSVKSGESIYHGAVFFVRKDSGIFRLRDLGGHTLALGREFSSNLHYLPLSAIKQKGLTYVKQDKSGAKPAANAVGYYFNQSMEARASDVFLKKVDAAVSPSADINRQVQSIFKNTFRVIYTCDDIPAMFVMVPADMDANKKNTIISILSNAKLNSRGKKALNFSNISDVYRLNFDWKALFLSLR